MNRVAGDNTSYDSMKGWVFILKLSYLCNAFVKWKML